MDGGPFRGQRPATGRAANRSESTPRQTEEPQPAHEVSVATHRATAPHHPVGEPKGPKRLIMALVTLLVVIALAIGGWLIWSGAQASKTAIDGSKYQAVFFTNGQVYFGKLQAFNNDYMKLTDIYYLQTQSGEGSDSENPQQTSNDKNGVRLIKLGDEIHGPQDEMIISKDQMLFYENLKSDGKVAQSIEQYKNK